MREIKFRGKMVTTKEWVYGDYTKDLFNSVIITYWGNNMIKYIVIPETVGQFTGLYDEDVREIYEGDILECEVGRNEIVEYKNGMFIGRYRAIGLYLIIGTQKYVKIIGNIHDK